jgi:hypothetical protein
MSNQKGEKLGSGLHKFYNWRKEVIDFLKKSDDRKRVLRCLYLEKRDVF